MNKDEVTVLIVSHGGTIAAILRYLAAEQGRTQLKNTNPYFLGSF